MSTETKKIKKKERLELQAERLHDSSCLRCGHTIFHVVGWSHPASFECDRCYAPHNQWCRKETDDKEKLKKRVLTEEEFQVKKDAGEFRPSPPMIRA